MFTTKTERLNACASTATRPRADDDRGHRDQQRHEPCDHGPEDQQEDDQCGGEAELELARLEIVLGELAEVVVQRPVAGDRDLERRPRVRPPDGADHAVDAGGGILRHRELDHRRVPVARDERGVAGRGQIRADALDPLRVAYLARQRAEERAEGRRVDRVARRMDDDEVGDRCPRGRREGGLAHVLRALRLWVVGRVPLGRQRAAQESPDRDERQHHCGEPGADRPPRVPRAGQYDGPEHRGVHRRFPSPPSGSRVTIR